MAIGASFLVCLVGAYGLKQAGHGPAATVALPIGVFFAAVLLFMSEDRRRAQNLAKEGSVFNRQAGRFEQDGKDICALADLDRVQLLETADCNGGIFELAVVTKDHAAFELVATYDTTGDEKTELESLGERVAEFCRLALVRKVDMRQGGR